MGKTSVTNHSKVFQGIDFTYQTLQFEKLGYIMNYGAKCAQNVKIKSKRLKRNF